MAKKITSSDLFDQEDLFRGVRESAIKTLSSLEKMNNELREIAQSLKSELAGNTQSSVAEIKKLNDATEQSNKVMREAIEIEKLQAIANQQKIKADQELIKLEKLKAQELTRQQKEQEKQAQAQAKIAKESANQSSAYKQLVATTRDLKNQSKELGAQLLALQKAGKQNSAEYAKLEKQYAEVTREAQKYDEQLKEVDKTVGDHFRNVGNYEGAVTNLKKELRELTRTLQNMDEADPRFQEMTQRAGQLKDQISDTNEVIKATAGSGVENLAGAIGNLGTIGVSAFQGVEGAMALFGVESENVQKTIMRMTALLNLGNAFKELGSIGDKIKAMQAGFTAFGSKAMTAFNGLTSAGKAFAVTGIGLIITGLGLLIANWDKLTGKEKFNFDEFKKTQALKLEILQAQQDALDVQYNTISKSSDDAVKGIEREIEIAELQGKNTDALYARRAKLIQETSTKAIEATEEERQAIKDRMRELERDNGKVLTNHKGYLENKAKLDSDAIRTEGEKKWRAQHVAAYEEAKALRERAYQMKAFREGEFDKAQAAEDELKIMKLKKAKEISDKLKAQRKEDEEELKRYRKEAVRLTGDMQRTDVEIEVQNIKEKYERRIALAKKLKKGVAEIEIAMMNEINNVYIQKLDEQLQEEMRMRQEVKNNRIKLENEAWADFEQLSEERYRLTLSDQEKEMRDLDEWYYSKKEMHKDNQEALNDVEIIYLNKRNDINNKYQKEQEDKDKEVEDKKKAQRQKEIEDAQKTAQDLTNIYVEQSNKRIAQIDKEIAAAQKQADYLKALAEEGNISASESLAEQERLITELNRKKAEEERKQRLVELSNTVYQTYQGYAKEDPKTALQKTIRDTTLLQAFINSLPGFEKGTEDTGVGGNIDNKGGFHAILHPHERVIPKSLNEQIGNLSNEELTRLASNYHNGKLVNGDTAHNSLSFALMISELRDLKQAIINKPETNIELGRITQSAMEIVQNTKVKNTNIYNRFKIRK
jgi:myosin heavy subunit